VTQHCSEHYAFGDFALDVTERRLRRRGTPVPLPPIAFDVLVALLRNAGRLVGKRDLLGLIWRDTFVEEGILTVYISLLRKALGDTARPTRYIQTVTRFGYRFIAPVVGSRQDDHLIRREPVCGSTVTAHVAHGRERLLNGSCFALRDAVDAFEAAMRADEADVAAYAGLALARCAQAQCHALHPRRAYQDATRAVVRALALDHDDPDAQVALGMVLFLGEWDAVGAERAVRRALQIDGEHIHASMLYGDLLDAMGHSDSALEIKMRALELSPTSPFVLMHIAQSFWRKRDFDATITWTRRALEQDSRHVGARMYLAYALWKNGRYDAVTTELIRQAESFGITREALTRASAASEQASGSDDWPSPFTRVVMAHLPGPAGGPSAINAAISSGERGERDTAFRHLDRAIKRRDASLAHLGVDPQWDRLRSDKRFHERLHGIGVARLSG
jgi:DNA-binding winged helix-turn-helix (wHTH) protein/cytochrome c-type biogenesis protein CcmH/NrfG